MTIAKKIFWVLLYLAAFIPVGFSVHYFSEKNLLLAFITSFISMLIYTLLVFKNIRFLSLVTFITMSLVVLAMLGDADKQIGGTFSNILDERIFMLTRSLLAFFLLINSVFLAKTKQGFKKLMPLFIIVLSVLMLIAFVAYPPAYYQNLVYMRGNILIILILGIYLIIKNKKFLGILGILLSIVMLLQSTAIFNKKAYTLEEKEQEEVIAYIDPVAKEMFGYYNKKDYVNFCKHCGFYLKTLLEKDPITIKDRRETSGPYTSFDKPSGVIRKSGRFYVEYPIKFQNVKDLMYLTFTVENITSNPPILYGYALSAKQGLHFSSGNENERDR